MKKVVKWLLLGLIPGFVFLGCKSSGPIPDVSTPGTQAVSKILFLNLRIFKDSTDNEKVTLIDKSWSEGSLKVIQEDTEGPVLTVSFYDKNDQFVKALRTKHPLKGSMESFSPEGEIERHSMSLNEAFFTIRTELPLNVSYLIITDDHSNQIVKIELK